MPSVLAGLKDVMLHLFFPQLCPGCGRELPLTNTVLCSSCLLNLAPTGFAGIAGNPVEKKFWGRIPVVSASACFHFRSGTLIQHLIHRFKYRSDRELCLQLGRLMGNSLAGNDRFKADFLVPLPLFADREHKRGYNQAAVLCEGISSVMAIPVESNLVWRIRHTDTQTRMTRTERWLNMEGRFAVRGDARFENKHLLLVDDIVTTGATLEACGQELLKIPGVTISITTLCYASQM
ncbi:MAG: phosphoribosyltransferase family protein [Chitinophagaceae bacterium]